MQFIKVSSPHAAAQAVLDRLKQELGAGKKVLWLLCGGSAIASEAFILKSLQQSVNLQNLSVMLMDERYGPAGHADSNWQQLQNAGCDFANISATPVLTDPQKPLQDTAAAYAQKVTVALSGADIIIGIFGLGEDGHTAGILPGSPATRLANQLVVGYETQQFQRITMTRYALTQISAAYVLAFGNAKATALRRLHDNLETFAQLPASLLRDIPEVYIYNEQLKEEVSG